MKVKPSLFLNMSPQTTEDGALAFARNMKLDDDGNLISDYGADVIDSMSNYNIVGHIVGLDNKIYFFCYNNGVSKIIEYDEISKGKQELTTKWKYSLGEIDGYVTTNQSGEKILTVAEYKDGVDIPLKHINLSYPYPEDESLYTQAPKVPMLNLTLNDTYTETIPNGVYVFFVRYKIRDNFYTPWYICSRPMFAGTHENITTLQGGLRYINIHKDSAKSFKFNVNFVNDSAEDYYTEFQLGFIITHDEATEARIWKSFSFDANVIYFDYNNIEEANIDDMLSSVYELYNVQNITSFKNKLYISNYKETDFNVDSVGSDIISNIRIEAEAYDIINIEDRHLYFKNIGYGTGDAMLNFNKDESWYIKGNYSDYIFGGTGVLTSTLTRYYNINLSDYIKRETKEKEDILTFDIGWKKGINDMEICYIYNIYNNCFNNEVFGADFPKSFDEVTSGYFVNAYNQETFWLANIGSMHPWLNIDNNMPAAYGHGNILSVSSYYIKDGILQMCKNSRSSYLVPGGSTTFSNVWSGDHNSFTYSQKTTIDNDIKSIITSKGFYGIAYIEINYGGKTYKLHYSSPLDFNYNKTCIDEMSNDNYVGHGTLFIPINNNFGYSTSDIQDIDEYVSYVIKATSVGFKEDGTPVLKIFNSSDNNDFDYVPVTNVNVVIKKFDFIVNSEESENTDDSYFKHFSVTLKTTDYISIVDISPKTNLISTNLSNITFSQESVLRLCNRYQVNIHLVDEKGIIYNGVNRSIVNLTPPSDNTWVARLRYYVRSDINVNSKYKSFFISILPLDSIVINCFGLIHKDGINIVNCIELDAMLYNLNDNISVYCYDDQNINSPILITDKAKYYPSGSSTPILAFGNCGYVSWKDEDVNEDIIEQGGYDNYTILIIVNKSESKRENIVLPKASGYIPIEPTDNATYSVVSTYPIIPDGFYGSYYCAIKKPDFRLASIYYVSGRDVYSINRTNSLRLKEFESYVSIQDSLLYFIPSDFNLNYLSLTEDVSDSIFSIGGSVNGVKEVAKVINSATLSSIYELKSMYKDFMNKKFIVGNKINKHVFNNTIRVSNVLSDETFNNSVFTFKATDYYNIPTDRGDIVKLFAIGNNIYAHTKSSLYKFDGNATITANDKDIQLQESEPFNAGITQVFDSEYGYGGIDTKQSGCMTFDSYFFYDKTFNHIFAFSGNSQVQLIDGNIYKFLDYYKPKSCITLHDEANCRVLFEFTSGRSLNVTPVSDNFTLSYNYKTKSFVSFHDLTLNKSFSCRNRCYSYYDTLKLYQLFDDSSTPSTDSIADQLHINNIFKEITKPSIIQFGSVIDKVQSSPFQIAIVTFPKSNIREVVDSVRYIGDVRKDTITLEEIDTVNYNLVINNQVTRTNPVQKFFIITDSCVSTPVHTNVNDEARPNSLLDYKGFKYDMGMWTSNYFRNAVNNTDVYEYGGGGVDNNSLVYGRYFILVFDFNPGVPVKFEEFFVNTDKY